MLYESVSHLWNMLTPTETNVILFGTDVRARVVFAKEENHLSDLVMLCQVVCLDIQSFEFTTIVNNIHFIQF